jgi:hypothetical protein
MERKGYNKKTAKIWFMAGVCFAIIVMMTFAIPQSALSGSPNDLEANAEVRRDYPAVYACFAPSSTYTVTHNYEQYLAQARQLPDRIVAYRIVRVSYIQNQEDRKTYPAVDKVAQVEVEVTFLHPPTQQRSEMNIGFIFLKEGGKWYKS